MKEIPNPELKDRRYFPIFSKSALLNLSRVLEISVVTIENPKSRYAKSLEWTLFSILISGSSILSFIRLIWSLRFSYNWLSADKSLILCVLSTFCDFADFDTGKEPDEMRSYILPSLVIYGGITPSSTLMTKIFFPFRTNRFTSKLGVGVRLSCIVT